MSNIVPIQVRSPKIISPHGSFLSASFIGHLHAYIASKARPTAMINTLANGDVNKLPSIYFMMTDSVMEKQERLYCAIHIGTRRYHADCITGTFYSVFDGKCTASNNLHADITTIRIATHEEGAEYLKAHKPDSIEE